MFKLQKEKNIFALLFITVIMSALPCVFANKHGKSSSQYQTSIDSVMKNLCEYPVLNLTRCATKGFKKEVLKFVKNCSGRFYIEYARDNFGKNRELKRKNSAIESAIAASAISIKEDDTHMHTRIEVIVE